MAALEKVFLPPIRSSTEFPDLCVQCSQYLNMGMSSTDFCGHCLDAIAMILSGSAPSLYIPGIAWEALQHCEFIVRLEGKQR